MSNLHYRELSLAGINIANLTATDLRGLVRRIVERKIHGISFSPYIEGQGPGTRIDERQIRQRLDIIKSHVKWIRSFSVSEGHEHIPRVAHKYGLKTMVGVWLDDDRARNDEEISNAIELGQAGHADILAVGNEVLLREELAEDELLDYIARVKSAVPNTPVGYVDAYFKFVDHPQVTAACDVLLANCYPFWEGCPAEHSLLYMKEMYRRVERVADGKKIIVSETGWPDTGTATKGAIPSAENAMKYFADAYQWAEEEDIEIFYFSSFDEAWKIDNEGDVGAYWGLWDKDGNPKYV